MNKIKCLNCNTILESKFRHDFQRCNCENQIYVDGGDDYQRIGGKDVTKILIWNDELQKFIKIKGGKNGKK